MHLYPFSQVLLDSRATVHQPVYAQKHQRASTMTEEELLRHAVGVAAGMEHLEQRKVGLFLLQLLDSNKNFLL